MLRKLIPVLLVMAAITAPALAQEKFTVFPQIADGRAVDGSYYRSTIMILPWFDSDATTCKLVFYGMEVALGGGAGRSFDIPIAAGGSFSMQTTTNQPLDTGYATLTCSEFVFANVLYTYYFPNGTKYAEATVFGSGESYSAKMIFDQTGGEHLGFAISNNTDLAHTYRVTVGARSGTIQVPARDSVSRFVDQVVTGLPFIGILKIEATDFSVFSAVGLRFTGGVFTTIPAN